ncbi:hypothetical protein WA026_001262 [Henosepilachna vigintioctopunctata]|uniref:Uncharacterized protein n=1 Tax=Henosepilachna vigintioctopunctata TaxID=420089 RepID=A0AAW1UQM4_9CUCU
MTTILQRVRKENCSHLKLSFNSAVKYLNRKLIFSYAFIGQTKAERELEASLYSMEILDRASPELWPENFPGMSEFTNKITQSKSIKLPYSRELTQDDQNYMHQLASLPTTELISRVKQLHDIAYQLGVEETKEITRGKYLNLFNKRRPKS